MRLILSTHFSFVVIGDGCRQDAFACSPDPELGACPLAHGWSAYALLRALRHTQGNRSLAARILGVSRTTLYTKLEAHGIE